jgi:oxygen-dependent protoporphyrinogen oxidase
VGAGIAGLAAALELQQHVPDVLVLDPADRPGGVMRTDHVNGYVIERGPNTFQVKAPMLASLQRDHVDGHLIKAAPASRRRCVYHDGQLVPVPMSPVALVGTKLLSARAKGRLLIEPFVRRGDGAGESVATFVERRLGREVVQNLVGPFLTGVYAGDEERLGAEPVFGPLVDAERRAGSIVLGLAAGAFGGRKPKGLSGVHSSRKGLGPFARVLAELLVEPPALGARVSGVRRDGDDWLITVSGASGESRLRTRHLVVATPARATAEILRGVSATAAAELDEIEYAPIASVAIGVRRDDVATPIDGFGFLVPKDAGIALLGCLFMSQLFPGRAPEGHELLQCMIGGLRRPDLVDLPDDQLAVQLYADLDRVLGLKGGPELLTASRWERAVPQPGPGHVARVARILAGFADQPHLALAGSWRAGVSVPDSFASGITAAHEALGS